MNLVPIDDLFMTNFLIKVKCLSRAKTTNELENLSVWILFKFDNFIDVNPNQVDSLNSDQFERILELALIDKRLKRVKVHGKDTILLRICVPESQSLKKRISSKPCHGNSFQDCDLFSGSFQPFLFSD